MEFCYFFFFTQKTAYEMRISDWSSDVCSSDLSPRKPRLPALARGLRRRGRRAGSPALPKRGTVQTMENAGYIALSRQMVLRREMDVIANNMANLNTPAFKGQSMLFVEYLETTDSGEKMSFVQDISLVRRSEEHTSELQSLMRISYAVFCLKK